MPLGRRRGNVPGFPDLGPGNAYEHVVIFRHDPVEAVVLQATLGVDPSTAQRSVLLRLEPKATDQPLSDLTIKHRELIN